MPVTRAEDSDSGYTFWFADAPITQVRFDFAVTLISLTDLDVRIEVPFRYWDGRAQRNIDPAIPATVAPLLDLHQAELHRVELNRTGELQIFFSDDRAITVLPHPDYESFSLRIPPDHMFIGDVGGGVGKYQPPAPNPRRSP
jgi:hypothetical protein